MIVSIFYNQSAWHELITCFIKPFINQEQNNILSWYIYLGSSRGDHVTLVFNKSGNCDADEFKARFATQIATYLSENASAIKEVEYPVQEFFMDFPNNSVEFDIETPSICYTHDSRLISINKHLSEILFEVLSEQEIDAEILYTFIIYLQFGIIKAAYPNIKQACTATLKLANYFVKQITAVNQNPAMMPRQEDYEDFYQLFEQNKQTLEEVIEDMWTSDTYAEGLEWMTKWEDSCRAFTLESNFQSSYIDLNEVLYEHLGFKGKKIAQILSEQTLKFFNQTVGKANIIRIA